jgi:PIN domain nuclease of toxin-antitoxin system
LFFKDEYQHLSKDVLNILEDYSNLFYTSSVCVAELLHLYKSENVAFKKSHIKNSTGIIDALHYANIEIVSVSEKHLTAYAQLEIPYTLHKDPNDHLIIAQSISDRMPVISSDEKFKLYKKQGLELVFNTRR